MPRAIIVGSSGQDGRLLYEVLEQGGYELAGLDIEHMRTNRNIGLPGSLNICDGEAVRSLIKLFKPDEIYHLAAFHGSSEAKKIEAGELWVQSYGVNTASLQHCLEAIRLYSPRTKIFYAASSHVFGFPSNDLQDEATPIAPVSMYGITKSMGVLLCRFYRKVYGIFSAAGILYNHESAYRGKTFISAKIVHGAIRIKKGEQRHLVVGDLNAVVDWGYAPDYINAMRKILELSEPDEFVIATGERHTVREFIELAFSEVGLAWTVYVEERKDLLARQSPVLTGNANKLRSKTGWRPTVTFDEMVRFLVRQTLVDYERTIS